MTLLRDLIDIPERVHKGDFVLKLTEGVLDPEATLRHYVVTDALAKAFDQALQLIESAVASRSSKATYLHGSFGSGKSHFMAVLYLLMHQDPRARAIPELAAVVDRHDTWLQGKRFLLVPFHLIGARNLESAVLGGYAEHLRRTHPEAAAPTVFLSHSILDNAERLRQQMGEDAFFEALSETARKRGGEDGGGWGALDAGWDAESYDAASAAAYDAEQQEEHEDKRRLISDVLDTFFPSYGVQAESTGAGFTSMDAGLSEIARHAAGLGYHGVVLFLDELILWLASRAGAGTFVEQQIEGLVKLVEAERADRPIPIVSFLARQRDLRKLIGDHMPGADRLRYVDKLDHYEGRFGKIVLEDRDLPKIVEKRLLAPNDDEARRQLDAAFDAAARARSQVVDVLMGERDRSTFRAVYPFSPALVDGLVAVSSVLQRERTALKILSELLVRGRDVLEVGHLVPVGDLWDVLEEGDEPFSEEMRTVFEQAKKLWRTKLRPMLEDEHRIEPGQSPARGHAFHGHARLLKTVLLAALAPEADALRSLTVSRLVALNHGSIRSPIPGQETQLATQKLREWVALGAGEIHLGEGANPSVSLELTGVDVGSILERVRAEDNQGNRARKVRELLYQSMAVSDEDQLFQERVVRWRGTQRVLDVAFGNVRDLPADTFESNGDRWRLVLDYPFDLEGFTPNDDLARLDGLRGALESQRTLCWLPSFFSRKGQAELGRLVLIDYLLAGERFEHNASHLPATERQSARALLRNQQTQLRERLRQALETAYGLRDVRDPLIDHGLDLEEHLQSLDPMLEPRMPAAPNFREALEKLAAQALEHQFPAHPDLGPDIVRKAEIARVHSLVAQAMEDPDRRLRVEDKKLRRLLERIAEPLRLGDVHEAHLQLVDFWIGHFEREVARAGGDMTVKALRDGIDRPRPMGLPHDLEDLLIRVFAERTQRTFTQYGAARTPLPGQRLEDYWGLEATELPSEAEWDAARELASGLFGQVPLSSLLTANNVADLVGKIREKTEGARHACHELSTALERRLAEWGGTGGERSQAQRSALEVLAQIEASKSAVGVLRRLAGFTPTPTVKAVARTIETATTVRRRLDDDGFWQLMAGLRQLEGDGERGEAANALHGRLASVLEHHELAEPLVASLDQLQKNVVQLLTQAARSAPAAAVSVDAATAEAPAALAPSATAASVAPEFAPDAAQSLSTTGWLQTDHGDGEFSDEASIREAIGALEEAALGEGDGNQRRLELNWKVWRRSGDTE